MLFLRKKEGSQNIGPSALGSATPEILTPGSLAIRFHNVEFGQIKNLQLGIAYGGWVLLLGDNVLGKAHFCDLSFGFEKPQSGIIESKLSGNQLSFLGRSQTTYGVTLLEHLSSGVMERSKNHMERVVEEVFSSALKSRLHRDSQLRFKNDTAVAQIDLSEREILEIAEANVILQKRPALIIDTETSLYQRALSQGFRHSALLLESEKTIFWLVRDTSSPDQNIVPWLQKQKCIQHISLYFDSEALPTSIN